MLVALPRNEIVAIDLACTASGDKHFVNIFNPESRRIMLQHNIRTVHYFNMHACMKGVLHDRFLSQYQSTYAGKQLDRSEVFLLDCSNEGNYHVKEVAQSLCEKLNLNRYQLIILSQGEMAHSQHDTVFYSRAFYDVSTESAKQLITSSLEESVQDIKDFVCLNNMPRPHRTALSAFLFSKGLLQDNYLSFTLSPIESLSSKTRKCPANDYIKQACFYFPTYRRAISEFVTVLTESDFRVTEFADKSKGVATSAGTPWPLYAATKFSIVTESDFVATSAGPRVTEKTFKSVAAGHPFILAGAAGTLRHLRGLGFGTFSPLINEDYDEPDTPDRRMVRICNSISQLVCDLKASHGLREQLRQLASVNQQHLFSGGLERRIVDRYHTTLSQFLAHWRA